MTKPVDPVEPLRAAREASGQNAGSSMPWSEARAAAHAAAVPAASTRRPLADCGQLVLAESVQALAPIPHYASAAMDGWAVAGPGPWELTKASRLEPGQAALTVTGAAVPPGATAVLRSESGSRTGNTVCTNRNARSDEPLPGQHIRQPGTEASTAEQLIPHGTRLSPAWLAVAAAAGHDCLSVTPRPRVHIFSTGDEVVPAGLPGPGQVRDTFSLLLPDAVRGLGGNVTTVRHLPDEPRQLQAALCAPEADVVITTGGTGHSRADHLRNVLSSLGADVVVDSIAMRPGHPALLAILPGGRPVIGLPGNPLAAMMALLTLAGPLLAGANGLPLPSLRTLTTAQELPPLPGRHRLIPAITGGSAGNDGGAENGGAANDGPANDGARLATHTGSAMMRGLAVADVVLVVPPEGVSKGAAIPALNLPW